MRGADARRRKRDRPEGVTQGFHVSLYKVDPYISVFAANLLTKDNDRASLSNEVVPGRPEVPLVSKPSSLACRAERLARTGTSPYLASSPAGLIECVIPDGNPGKEVQSVIPGKVIWSDIFNTALIYVPFSNPPFSHQIAKPLSGIRINLVVISPQALIGFDGHESSQSD
jgi:hypothetical protein